MKISNSQVFLFSLISFIVGVATASFLPSKFLQEDILFFAGFVLFLVLTFVSFKKIAHSIEYSIEYSNLPGLVFLFLAFLSLGFWRYSISFPSEGPSDIWYYNGEQVKIVGVLESEPDRRDKNQKIEISVEKLYWDEKDTKEVSGKILLTTNLYPIYNYGDYLEVECKLSAPEAFEGFAYDRYLAKSGIYSVCSWPKIKVLQTGRSNRFYSNIFKFKNKLSYVLNYGLEEPQSSLAGAIILGEKKSISEDIRNNFSRTGLSHIIAISGLHISILSTMLMLFLIHIGLWRKQAFYVSLILIFVYVVLVGAPASAVRAGLMGFLVLLGLNLGRLSRIYNSIALAAFILLFANPRLFRDDIGFQLSFLAVIGIVYFYPRIEKIFKNYRIPNPWGVRNILSVTLSAQILTWPILAVNFNQVSLIAPLANILVIWFLPVLMMALIFGLVLGLLLPGLSFLFFLPANVILLYIIQVADFLSNLPFSNFNFS